MKKVVALALTCLLLVQVAGFYLFMAGRIAYLHEQSRERLKEKPIALLERIELSEQHYREARVNHREIKLNGKMYDIGHMERLPGCVILYAERDEAEEDLFAFIQEVFYNAAADDEPVPSHVITLTSLQYLVVGCMRLPGRPCELFVHRGAFDSRLIVSVAAQDTPPPEA